jgi:type IV pilus assembly protein PilO
MASLYPRTQREQLLVFVGLLGVIAAGAFWYLKYDPRMAELTVLEERIDRIDAANQRAKTELARGSVNTLRAQGDSLAADLAVMRELVPEGNEVPLLLEQISTAARQVGLDIGSVEPLGVESGNDFDAHRYRFRLNGAYHTVAEFLSSVGSLSRIVTPTSLALTAAATTTTPPRPGLPKPTVTATFELHTYVVRTAAPAPGGTP